MKVIQSCVDMSIYDVSVDLNIQSYLGFFDQDGV